MSTSPRLVYITNKHVKRRKRIIRERQIKTIVIYHYTSINIAKQKKTKKSDHTRFWPRCGGTVILIHCWTECQMVTCLGRHIGKYFRKLNKYVPYDLAILFPAIT